MSSNSRVAIVAVLASSWLSFAAVAQDAVILNTGEALRGHVLRYDSERFSILVSNEVREVSSEDVHSIFFGVEEGRQLAQPEGAVTSTPPRAATSAPPAVAATTSAPPKTVVAKPPPTRADYGVPEGNFTVSELIARCPQLDGKVIKLEFFARSLIREITPESYVANVNDTKAYMDVQFGKDAYGWFEQTSDHVVYIDATWRKPRSYFVYGVVGVSSQQVMVAGRLMPGCSFRPIGRKTKKGMRGAMEYEW